MIASSMYLKRSTQLSAFLQSEQAIVIYANSHVQKSIDAYYPFYQDRDFFYFTGLEELTDAQLWIIKGKDSIDTILIIPDYDEKTALRDGPSPSLQDIQSQSGVDIIYTITERSQQKTTIVSSTQTIFTNQLSKVTQDYPHLDIQDICPHIEQYRIIKDPYELSHIQTACDITTAGYIKLLQHIHIGCTQESELAALWSAHCINQHSAYAFDPIFASDKNGCILHYTKNRDIIAPGSMVLCDLGARRKGYCADLSRTRPAGGVFTDRQAQVYDACYAVYEHVCKHITPGVTLSQLYQIAFDSMTLQLIDLGLIDPLANTEQTSRLTRQYFPHSIGHFIGLEVHDIGTKDTPLAPGMVITVEPGIYISAESLGIRLENTIIITDVGYRDCFAGLPIKREEVQAFLTTIS